MKKTTNQRYHESYVEETLDNGLHVVLWDKPDYEKSLFMMVTPLGALDLIQVDKEGETYTFPAGIAHFLEHKMFEMEQGDVMDRFSQMGANVNAFTSYTETAYYFSTTEAIEKPLELLLDFVQDLSISKESVEKEKGIIIQELNMYKQMSDSRLLMETYSSLYKEHPLKYDIGGDAESVTAITLEDLQKCYQLNYHPSKMILIGVSKEDPEKLMDIIRRNQNAKSFAPVAQVTRYAVDEPLAPARDNFSFQMDVSIPKLAVAFKLEGIKETYQRIKEEWCIKIMLDANFSSLYPAFQTWIDDGVLNDYVGCEVDLGEDHGMVMFYAETNQKDVFLEIVEETMVRMQEGNLEDRLLEQLKRRYFGQAVRSLNSFDDIAITYARNYFDQSDFFKTMDVLDGITKEDVLTVCEKLKNAKRCIVEVLPEK